MAKSKSKPESDAAMPASEPAVKSDAGFFSEIAHDVAGLAATHNVDTAEQTALGDGVAPGPDAPEVEVALGAAESVTHAPANPNGGPLDPTTSVAGFLLAVGRVYNEMTALAAAASGHLPAIAAQPELHGFVSRIELACGEFRHVIEQLNANLSDDLSQAIHDGIMAAASR